MGPGGYGSLQMPRVYTAYTAAFAWLQTDLEGGNDEDAAAAVKGSWTAALLGQDLGSSSSSSNVAASGGASGSSSGSDGNVLAPLAPSTRLPSTPQEHCQVTQGAWCTSYWSQVSTGSRQPHAHMCLCCSCYTRHSWRRMCTGIHIQLHAFTCKRHEQPGTLGDTRSSMCVCVYASMCI